MVRFKHRWILLEMQTSNKEEKIKFNSYDLQCAIRN